jgi:predicted phage baseplate assembly protein
MNCGCQDGGQAMCGCCAGITRQTPQPITNRPSLSAIRYRVGTQPEFKASLLAALSDSSMPALAGLRTRLDSDFTIALLDAWATVSDILTFYQERIANELYLRTAVDQRSVFELAALVGYKPAPGVSASAYIAFTLNSSPGSPDNVLIPSGSAVQSVPGPGQNPQVFETSADLTALIEYNAIPAQTTLPWKLSTGDSSLWLSGTATGLKVGDAILFVGPTSAEFHYVTSVATDPGSGNTLVTWDQDLSVVGGTGVQVVAFKAKAQIYGAQAPDPRMFSNHVPIMRSADFAGGPDWAFAIANFGSGTAQVCLDAIYPGLAPGASGTQWALFVNAGSPSPQQLLYSITAADEYAPMHYTLTTKTTRVTLANEQDLTAATQSTVVPTQLSGLVSGSTRNCVVYVQSSELAPADPPYAGPWNTWSDYPQYATQPGMLTPVEGTSLEVADVQELAIGQAVAVFGRYLRLQVNGGGARFKPAGASTWQPVSMDQEFIISAFPPENDTWQVVTTSGVAGTLKLDASDLTLVPSASADPAASEAAIVQEAVPNGSNTLLTFSAALAGIYDRATVTVNANVALATDGQTVNEILGSGDSTNPALQFTLKQTPLTYLSSPAGNGAVSTLQVWVNNLQWHEVGNFLASGPSDRVFVTVMNEDQSVTVQFGDGIAGARTPTGQMNIRAVYRVGIGLAGMVQTGQLTQPLARPQGLKSTTNPSPATGGGDPDTAQTARTGAPLNVMTIGRVVSLDDYQNYALVFGGISKALATWTWFNGMRGVFLSVLGPAGAAVGPPTTTDLITACANVGNPHVAVKVGSQPPVLFDVGAQVQVDTNDYSPTLVLAQVWAALSAAFGFDQRQFGEGVAQSEVVAVIQQVPGVIAVEITAFYNANLGPAPGALPSVLRASAPVPGSGGTLTPAELLVIDPACQGLIVPWALQTA